MAWLCRPDRLRLELEGFHHPGIEGWIHLEGKAA
jgi:hypothetical protein